MRWESLFADMEAQLDAASMADHAADVADLTRAERATVELADRLRTSQGSALTILVAGATPITGVLVEVAAQWLLVSEGTRRALVPMRSVVAVRGVAGRAAPAPSEVVRRLGLGSALRALARDRVRVQLTLDGAEVAGRIERVGSDHLDLTAGFEGEVPTTWSVPFRALRVLRST